MTAGNEPVIDAVEPPPVEQLAAERAALEQPAAGSDLIRQLRASTPGRVFIGGSGLSYRTSTSLELRADHAAARDAVAARLDLDTPALAAVVDHYGIFEISTMASTPAEHLLRPDLGRRLSTDGRRTLLERATPASDLQVLIGDGLSAAAVHAQVPALLPAIVEGARRRGWSVGAPFAVRHCRVGVLNDVGASLRARAVVLLVGERPGLSTAESLSAYLAWCPRPGHTDADRNLVSNIHAHGIDCESAAAAVLGLVAQMRAANTSGVAIKRSGG